MSRRMLLKERVGRFDPAGPEKGDRGDARQSVLCRNHRHVTDLPLSGARCVVTAIDIGRRNRVGVLNRDMGNGGCRWRLSE